MTADTKRPIGAFFWSRDSKYILFVAGPGRRRELQRLRGRIRPTRPACRRRGAEGAQPDRRRRARARSSTTCRAQHRPDLCRPQRSRCRLARPLRGEDLDRRAEAAAQEHRQDLRLGVRSRRQAAAGDAHRRQRRHRGPARRPTPASRRSTRCSVFETLRPAAVPQGQRARLHGDQPRRARSDAPGALQSATRRRRSSSSPIRRTRSTSAARSSRRRPTSSSPPTYVGDRTRTYFRDKAFEADYKLVEKKLPGTEVDLRRRRRPTNS